MVQPSDIPPLDDEQSPRTLNSPQQSIELSTGTPHTIRIIEEPTPDQYGRVNISSRVAGSVAAIDGGDYFPLPDSVELVAGPHEIVFTCPGTGQETHTVTAEAESTVNIVGCSPRP